MMCRVARLVRTPYHVPHRPPLPRGSQEGAIKSGGAGNVSSTQYVPIAPRSQEWHGVASGEACGVYVRVCGVWGACRTRLELYIEQNKKRQQVVSFLSFIREETEKNAFGAWERTVADGSCTPYVPIALRLVVYVRVCKGYY
jgi:hypothetical protein